MTFTNANVEIWTKCPVATDSPDHIWPDGTMKDNTPDCGFIADVEAHFGRTPLRFLDLGCAGGQFVADALARGHIAVGLEGSDYSRQNGRANWPELDGKALFTCDITKDYLVFQDKKPLRFDCVTAWDVLEHIKEEDHRAAFELVKLHMAKDGIFCGKIYCGGGDWERNWHQTSKPWEWWSEHMAKYWQSVEPCPITHFLRGDHFLFCVRPKWN